MSTTFDVYPGNTSIPSFLSLKVLTELKLHGYFEQHGVAFDPQIDVRLISSENREIHHVNLDDPFWWSENYYAWFTLNGVEGGTDAHILPLDEQWARELRSDWLCDHPQLEQTPELEQVYTTAQLLKRSWYFRRSIGQPAAINVLYGFLTSALAELTEGVVDSNDGAWDFARFPALPQELDRWYMNPQEALDSSSASWASACLTALSPTLPNHLQ